MSGLNATVKRACKCHRCGARLNIGDRCRVRRERALSYRAREPEKSEQQLLGAELHDQTTRLLAASVALGELIESAQQLSEYT